MVSSEKPYKNKFEEYSESKVWNLRKCQQIPSAGSCEAMVRLPDLSFPWQEAVFWNPKSNVFSSLKVLKSLLEEGGPNVADNPHHRDIYRHIYDLIWQGVRDKVWWLEDDVHSSI